MLRPGDTVGDFVLEGLIGTGGMGSVYRAHHPIIGRRVAIKVLNSAWNARADAVARFVREARTIHRIKHRGVPDVLTFGSLADGTHYYVMELLEGEDLRTRLRRLGHLSPANAVRIVSGVASIIDAAHEAGIIHRDLKPENVYLTSLDLDDFEVKLLDFGIAKLAGENDGLVTASHAIIGTPVYMAPEQCLGSTIDRRCDIYSLGVLAYEMLIGTPPFPANAAQVFEQKLSGETPRIARANKGLARFDRAIASALSKDPDRRQATAAELAAELERALGDPTVHAFWVARRMAGIALLALLGFTGAAYYAVVHAVPPKEIPRSFAAPQKPAMIAPVKAPEPEPPIVPPPPDKRSPEKRDQEREAEPEIIIPDMPVSF